VRTAKDNIYHFFMGFFLMLFSFVINLHYTMFAVTSYTMLNLLFIIYELNEDWHISDDAFIDIFYFGWGQAISFTAMVII
jgi:hypothetical protein